MLRRQNGLVKFPSNLSFSPRENFSFYTTLTDTIPEFMASRHQAARGDIFSNSSPIARRRSIRS